MIIWWCRKHGNWHNSPVRISLHVSRKGISPLNTAARSLWSEHKWVGFWGTNMNGLAFKTHLGRFRDSRSYATKPKLLISIKLLNTWSNSKFRINWNEYWQNVTNGSLFSEGLICGVEGNPEQSAKALNTGNWWNTLICEIFLYLIILISAVFHSQNGAYQVRAPWAAYSM